MEDLKMDVSSFNSEEVVQLLLNALKISNDKCQVLSNTVTNLHNQRQEIDLAKTKITLEKNHIIDSLKTKINLLNTELVENKKSLEDVNQQVYLNHTYLKKFDAFGFEYDADHEFKYLLKDKNGSYENEYTLNDHNEFVPGITHKK